MNSKWYQRIFSIGLLLMMVFSNVMPAAASSQNPPAHPVNRYIMIAKSAAEFDKMRADALANGATIVKEVPQVRMLVVTSATSSASKLAESSAVQAVAPDRIQKLVKPQFAQEMGFNASPERKRIDMGGNDTLAPIINPPDPANTIAGLLWDFGRLRSWHAWQVTPGNDTVIVGVADTGLDYTHSELADKVSGVVDFTDSLCYDYYGMGDADFSTLYGGPADTDWNGHGTWIGGNIAAAADEMGMNGIAPGVSLVALKISQWCGSAWDSTIIDSFAYAADKGIDVVSISFGGYLDRTDPDQEMIYETYKDVVNYARSKGTVIVAAAGNDHVRIGAGGKVLSHGILTVPGSPAEDYYNLYEVPGGIPGVVMVSATGNVVNAPKATCPAGTTGSPSNGEATCKPTKDAHQPFGVGRINQLTYYSNYGPRIDIAAPGGARKFNLPSADRGGTGGYPYVLTEGFKTWETFSITSNWALQIPCYYDLGLQFYPGECYSTIQGTSMAAPHVSAVVALIASKNPDARHNPSELVRILKTSATDLYNNTTPALSATDKRPGDRTLISCLTGYCHLGGKAISDLEAFGAGLVNAYRAVVTK